MRKILVVDCRIILTESNSDYLCKLIIAVQGVCGWTMETHIRVHVPEMGICDVRNTLNSELLIWRVVNNVFVTLLD